MDGGIISIPHSVLLILILFTTYVHIPVYWDNDYQTL